MQVYIFDTCGDLLWLPNLGRYFMQNLDIVVWFLSSWQQIMLILVFPVKSTSQNDVFWGYRPQIPSVQLKNMVFICPKQCYKQKTYQD